MQRFRSILASPPAVTPVALEDAKRRVRRVEDDDNDEIEMLIAAVVSHLEGADGIMGRALITQDWSDTFDSFPRSDRIDLRLAPVQSIVSINYIDANGAEATLSPSKFTLHSDASGCFIRLSSTAAWPATDHRDDAVTVIYRAGYGDTPADVPAAIRLAILDLVAHRFNNRAAVLVGVGAVELPRSVAADLAPYKRPHF